MAVAPDMLWLGSLTSVSARDRQAYACAGPRVDKEYAGTLENAVEQYCDHLRRARYEGAVYFSMEKRKDVWYVKGYPFKKQ